MSNGRGNDDDRQHRVLLPSPQAAWHHLTTALKTTPRL
jgi:hypothetical protein